MTVTITEEQREAADNLRESMRIFNHAIREAAYRGLHVEVKLLQLHRKRRADPGSAGRRSRETVTAKALEQSCMRCVIGGAAHYCGTRSPNLLAVPVSSPRAGTRIFATPVSAHAFTRYAGNAKLIA
jgi:hypothetical protein